MSVVIQDEVSFRNTLPDFEDGNSETIVFDVETNNASLKPEFKTKLQNMVEKLMLELDFNSNRAVEKNYTVYAGFGGVAMLELLNRKFKLGCIENSKAVQNAVSAIISIAETLKDCDRRVSFLEGPAGVFSLALVLSYNTSDDEYKVQCLNKLRDFYTTILRKSRDTCCDEFLYGKAGYMYALLFLQKHVTNAPIRNDHFSKLANRIIECGNPRRLKYEWHGKEYLGAAHGYCGIAHTLLLAKVRNHLSNDVEINVLLPLLDRLLALRLPSNNFPSSISSKHKDRLVQWCHGAPGAVYTFCLAAEVFGERKYLQAAEEAGEVIWQRGLLRKGYSLCHGIAGNGYAFLRLYQATKNRKYLHRACQFANWCCDNYGKVQTTIIPDRPFSLYEGIVGLIYFLIDIQDPLNSKFPGFDL